MSSKDVSSTIFWVFGMTRQGIEPRSPGSLANTLTIMQIGWRTHTHTHTHTHTYIYIYIYILWPFHTSVYSWSDINSAVVWMVSFLPFIANFSSFLSKPLGIVPSLPITIGITVISMFLIFFNPPARSKYLFMFLFSFISTLCYAVTSKSTR